MTARIYKTLTEHINGRIQDPESPTGWKRQTGSTSEKVAGQRRPVVTRIYAPVDPPKTYVYGTADPETGEVLRGGTLHTVIEGIEPAGLFNAAEVELVVRRHCSRFDHALSVLNGNYVQGMDVAPPDAYREAAFCRERVLDLLGVDLDDTNVAFPYRLTKPNHTKAFEFEGPFIVRNETSLSIF